MKKIIFIMLVSLATKGFTQCQNVCISGTPTVVVSGGGSGGLRQSTQDSILSTLEDMDNNLAQINQNTLFYHPTVVYTYVNTSGSHSTPNFAHAVFIANVGTTNALFQGATLPPGASINFADNGMAYYPSMTYNAQTSILMVVTSN